MGKLTQSTAEIQEILNGYNALKEQVEKLATGGTGGKTAWQVYQEWSELSDDFWQNEEAYNKYLSVRDGMCGIDTRRPEYKSQHYEKTVSWDTYGFTWSQFVTIKDRNPEYAIVDEYDMSGMVVGIKNGDPEEEEIFYIRVNPNNETIYLIGY